LIKDPKDLDTSLVSNKKLSNILSCSSWALVQVTWAKMAESYITSEVTHKKPGTQNQ